MMKLILSGHAENIMPSQQDLFLSQIKLKKLRNLQGMSHLPLTFLESMCEDWAETFGGWGGSDSDLHLMTKLLNLNQG